MSRCCSTITDSTTAGRTSSRSGGCSTSRTQALNAAARRVPAICEIWRCRRSSTQPTSGAGSGHVVGAGICAVVAALVGTAELVAHDGGPAAGAAGVQRQLVVEHLGL